MRKKKVEATTTLLPPPSTLLASMVLLSLCEDSISATQQLRSHRSKQPK